MLTCGICGKEFQSLGFSRHNAMHYDSRKYAEALERPKEPVIGQAYHVAWAKKECVWILVSYEAGKCTLRTPRSGKFITAKFSDLRLTRRHETSPAA